MDAVIAGDNTNINIYSTGVSDVEEEPKSKPESKSESKSESNKEDN